MEHRLKQLTLKQLLVRFNWFLVIKFKPSFCKDGFCKIVYKSEYKNYFCKVKQYFELGWKHTFILLQITT